jgi:hypothetical protein
LIASAQILFLVILQPFRTKMYDVLNDGSNFYYKMVSDCLQLLYLCVVVVDFEKCQHQDPRIKEFTKHSGIGSIVMIFIILCMEIIFALTKFATRHSRHVK